METTLAVIGLFLLRLGAPAAMMAFLVWAIRRYERQEKANAMESLQAEGLARKASETVTRTS